MGDERPGNVVASRNVLEDTEAPDSFVFSILDAPLHVLPYNAQSARPGLETAQQVRGRHTASLKKYLAARAADARDDGFKDEIEDEDEEEEAAKLLPCGDTVGMAALCHMVHHRERNAKGILIKRALTATKPATQSAVVAVARGQTICPKTKPVDTLVARIPNVQPHARERKEVVEEEEGDDGKCATLPYTADNGNAQSAGETVLHTAELRTTPPVVEERPPHHSIPQTQHAPAASAVASATISASVPTGTAARSTAKLATGKTSAVKTIAVKTSAASAKPTAVKATVPKPSVAKSAVAKAGSGKAIVGNASATESIVEKATVAMPSAEKAIVEKAPVATPSVRKATVATSRVRKAVPRKTLATVEKPTVIKPTVAKPSAGKPSAGNASVGKATVGKATVVKVAAAKAIVAKATDTKVTVAKPDVAAKKRVPESSGVVLTTASPTTTHDVLLLAPNRKRAPVENGPLPQTKKPRRAT